MLGHETILAESPWPSADPAFLVDDTLLLPVQVNGKVRATIRIPRGASQEDVQQAALAEENVRRHLDRATVRKVVYVPDKLINLVVG